MNRKGRPKGKKNLAKRVITAPMEPRPTKILACVPDRFRVKQDSTKHLERSWGFGECP